MPLFTNYIYQKYIPEQQRAMATRGVPASDREVEASTAEYVAPHAYGQARSNVLGGRMGLARRSLKDRAGEFEKRLALARRGSDLRTKLSEFELGQTKDYLQTSNSMFPVNVGLGLGNVGLGYFRGLQAEKQAKTEAGDIERRHQEIMSKYPSYPYP